MTIENVPGEGANDTVLTVNDQPTFKAAIADEAASEGAEDQAPELDDDGNPIVRDETEELEWDGKKWVLPKDAAAAFKPALLRQADYTKKTMEVAEARKALDADREGFKAQTEAQKAHFASATKLAAIDDRLGEYAKVNWQELYATNPDLYQQHRIAYDQLKDQRDTAARDFSQQEQERQTNAQRESAKRNETAIAEIARHVPGWTPGGELDLKLSAFGTSLGFTPQELGQLAIQHPRLVKEINRLRLYDEAAQKQKPTQSFQKSQEAAPVTRVGGNGGTAQQRKTTDSSGDALSTDEWVKREEERVAKQRQAMGRR